MALGLPDLPGALERRTKQYGGKFPPHAQLPVIREEDEKPYSKRRLDERESRIREWILENRGALSRIARSEGVSKQFVQMIAYGREGRRSAGLRVERTLRDLGCPLGRRIPWPRDPR